MSRTFILRTSPCYTERYDRDIPHILLREAQLCREAGFLEEPYENVRGISNFWLVKDLRPRANSKPKGGFSLA